MLMSPTASPTPARISRLLVVEPEKRLTMEGMLGHKWLAAAVAEGRAAIAAASQKKTEQQQHPPIEQPPAAAQPVGTGTRAANGGSEKAPTQTDIQPRVEGNQKRHPQLAPTRTTAPEPEPELVGEPHLMWEAAPSVARPVPTTRALP